MIDLLERFRKPRPASENGGGVTDPSNTLAGVFDHIAEGVCVVDVHGHVLLSNEPARRLLEIVDVAMNVRALWEHVRQPALEPLIRQALQTATPQSQELSIFAPKARILQVYVVPASKQRAFVVLHDVTELRRLERVRQDFIANVSHELRTPLTSLSGFIETLQGGALDDPAHNRTFLNLMKEDVDRLARLTDDLLELSKAEALGRPKSLHPIDVTAIIEKVIAILAPQIRAKRVAVGVDRSSFLPDVKGDPDQLQQVFWNLLDNAVKYNVEGGRITIRSRYHKTFVYIDIEDTGIGISPGELPRIFERFYRVDKARSRALGGTGLGLSIVKHIVEAHGGYVEVTSEPGKGSTFRVTLPVWLDSDAN